MAPAIVKKQPSRTSELSREVCIHCHIIDLQINLVLEKDIILIYNHICIHITLIMSILQHLSLTKSYTSRQDFGASETDWMRGKILLKPDDQLQLTEAVCLIFYLLLLNVIKRFYT